MKVGIIRCEEHSKDCAGYGCFPAVTGKTGKFEGYEAIELVGFDTCGGCGRGKAEKIIEKGRKLKEKGAEVIHLGNCLVGPCPSADLYKDALSTELDISVISGTHP